MDYIEIKKCRVCGNEHLTTIFDVGSMKLTGVFPDQDENDPISAPMELVFCDSEKGCNLVQLKHSVNPGLMYGETYGYRSGINKTMTEHLSGIVSDALNKIELKENDYILDIGSNDCTLLKNYDYNKYNCIGIDPSCNKWKEFYPNEIKYVSDFFTYENFISIAKENKAKIITSIAMFYDLESPLTFAKEIRKCLDKNGIWIFEQSYFPEMINIKSIDTICHEHLEYYTLKTINWILEETGFKVMDFSFNKSNGGSIRIYATPKESILGCKIDSLKEMIEKEKIEGFFNSSELKIKFNNILPEIEKLKNFLHDAKDKDKKVYGYGASTKGNVLLQYFNLDSQYIKGIADRNPIKFGKVTPGTRIPIVSEKEARDDNPDYFLVLPWHFRDEFIKRENDFLKKGGKLVFPLPKFEIYGLEND